LHTVQDGYLRRGAFLRTKSGTKKRIQKEEKKKMTMLKDDHPRKTGTMWLRKALSIV